MPLCKLPASGLTIGYDETGTGTPLVLLHAFPLDRGMWRPQLAALGEAARVVALDLPGFGESSPAGTGIEGAADAVAEFLAVHDVSKAVVCGLSMGGYVALALARKHPDTLAGLVLADTRAGVDDRTTKANRTKSIALVEEQGSAALFETMLPKVVSEHTLTGRPDVIERLKALAARQPAPSVIAALGALRDRPDANPGLKAITVPTLVLVGEYDAVTPPLSAANLSAQIRRSTLLHIPGAGHLSNVENPDAFNAAVCGFVAGLK
ncbi:alpha/beta fold hydrolase [Frigoriglobus tundricola]|uniref:Beta-ketoadipate enol-lactone hydrolase n=1 Tax=Frigoriglobus tundricola TaxID=2774151 RepID=A0A6M5YW76_9BACT|nr:alpha/beta fold hydrolase [Frigoriglobus tundricola]QJW97463.1 Beta-ketoadipate enol-lactone hydrolase [Frigoriglobus tundricola]